MLLEDSIDSFAEPMEESVRIVLIRFGDPLEHPVPGQLKLDSCRQQQPRDCFRKARRNLSRALARNPFRDTTIVSVENPPASKRLAREVLENIVGTVVAQEQN